MTIPNGSATVRSLDPDHTDVIVVGAGLSGIGAGWRLANDSPGTSFVILERRATIGGTWDLFRYPGVRADSDMFTLSYPFRPWRGARAIADGASIRDYVEATAGEAGLEQHLRFGVRVLSASWSSTQARWTVSTEADGVQRVRTCSFLYLCTGYYDYDRGHRPDFVGLADYAGTFVEPQFWPDALDHSGKKVVVIGSGATAMTVAPAMADTAAKVTMLQRTPTYVASLPGTDIVADMARKLLPAHAAHKVARAKWILHMQAVYALSRGLPDLAKKIFRADALRRLRDPAVYDAHFTPDYQPWDQRLCLVPDGDLFKSIRAGGMDVVTAHIERFVPEGIRLTSGEVLPADIVVCATGLRLLPLGGLAIDVDGVAVRAEDTVAFRACMLSGVPNLAFCFGYINVSWTLRADLSSRLVCDVINRMRTAGHDTVVPVLPAGERLRPFIDTLTAGYVNRGIAAFPKQGTSPAWAVGHNYLRDALAARRSQRLRGLRFSAHQNSGLTPLDSPAATSVGTAH